MRTRRWCAAAILAIATLDCSSATPQAAAAALSSTTQDSEAGHVQAAGNESSTTVKPGRNGYGTVTYGSASIDSGKDAEATANRLALEEAQRQHPNLRLRLGIGI
uniref:SEP1 n=1 Tax=Phytophthora sojae TaxID=67593 RepID=A0A7U3S177_PHYSO|nr:SEP1 [Phytophthora sojae]